MTRAKILRSLFCAGLAFSAATARAQDAAAVLSGEHATEHFRVRYRPGSRSGASVERTGAVAERDLAGICSFLEVKNDVKYSLFLFDDVPELSAVTRTAGNGGFSAGDASYVPFDDDQTRAHELVHIVAKAKLPKTGEEPRSLFFAEGLANALLEYVHGVHVHGVAKYYKQSGKLPRLTEMLGAPDFYAWLGKHPGFNAYDVAASWMRFLVDAHGVAKVKQYYGGKSAKAAFGSELETLEKAWLAALDKYVLRPEVEALLKLRSGEGESGVTAETFTAKDGWTDVIPVGTSRSWTSKDDVLTGTCDSDRWSVWEFTHDLVKDCAVTARVRLSGAGRRADAPRRRQPGDGAAVGHVHLPGREGRRDDRGREAPRGRQAVRPLDRAPQGDLRGVGGREEGARGPSVARRRARRRGRGRRSRDVRARARTSPELT